MKIVGFQSNGGLHLGVVEGDQVIDLQAVDSAKNNAEKCSQKHRTGGEFCQLVSRRNVGLKLRHGFCFFNFRHESSSVTIARELLGCRGGSPRTLARSQPVLQVSPSA